MAARAKRANLAEFDRIMAQVPAVEPPDYDRLPEGYQPAHGCAQTRDPGANVSV